MKKQKCDIKTKEQQLRACLGVMNFTLFASLLLNHLNCFIYSLEISYKKNSLTNILQGISFVQSAQSILLTVQSKGRLIKEIIKYWLYFVKLSALFLLSLELRFLTWSVFLLVQCRRGYFFLLLLCQLDRAEAMTLSLNLLLLSSQT